MRSFKFWKHEDIEKVYRYANVVIVRQLASKETRFPKNCIVCGGDNPDTNYRTLFCPVGITHTYPGFHMGENIIKKHFNVPCHKACTSIAKRRFWRDYSAFIILIILLFVFIKFIDEPIMLLYSLPFVFGWFFYIQKRPQPFMFNYVGKSIEYIFNNKFYAESFANLNGIKESSTSN